ncbi:Replication protein A subunit A like [Actinidia chinensis var. chinensis]|uniref:Replication protein A subunit A like n=1 Tax=Actinidia chinensis var. chinensis TaxID=1590841 RepID=A0A2R6PD77_ACTCC|nr:Replication protein A subunit A like [Actinidia chinensis var. chinensis]
MFASQFDSNSAFNGGGFVSSQSTDLGSSLAKSRETYGLVPVTVKQISEASHSGDDKSNFVVDGVDVANVTLIGIVSKKAEKVTDVAFTIDDGTGLIACNRWKNEAFDTTEMEDIQDGMYVRVNGRLKFFQGKRQLVAFSVRPVTNFDEIAFHFIECIHFHLQNSGAKLQGDTTTQPRSVNPSQNTGVHDRSNGYQKSPSSQLSVQLSVVDGLKGFDQMVIDYLQQPANYEREKGVHRDELSQKLKIPMGKIMESIRTLEEEGLIYSTIDEFHFKSTTSG